MHLRTKKAIKEELGPSPIVRLFFDNWKAYNNTLEILRNFHSAYPEIPCWPPIA